MGEELTSAEQELLIRLTHGPCDKCGYSTGDLKMHNIITESMHSIRFLCTICTIEEDLN